jgi:heterodisulfide reductase subunit C
MTISTSDAPSTRAPGARLRKERRLARHPALPHPDESRRRELIDEIRAAVGTDARLDACIQCGTCAGSCPSAAAMDRTPRELFALIRAGLRDDVLAATTPWVCVSCYLCAVRCPQEVHIPDVMYALRGIAARSGSVPDPKAADFSRTFVDNIHRYGRSYEVGLVARHYLRHFPLRIPGMAPTGLGMVASGRMALLPHRIRGVKGLRAILARAEELEARP